MPVQLRLAVSYVPANVGRRPWQALPAGVDVRLVSCTPALPSFCYGVGMAFKLAVEMPGYRLESVELWACDVLRFHYVANALPLTWMSLDVPIAALQHDVDRLVREGRAGALERLLACAARADVG